MKQELRSLGCSRWAQPGLGPAPPCLRPPWPQWVPSRCLDPHLRLHLSPQPGPTAHPLAPYLRYPPPRHLRRRRRQHMRHPGHRARCGGPPARRGMCAESACVVVWFYGSVWYLHGICMVSAWCMRCRLQDADGLVVPVRISTHLLHLRLQLRRPLTLDTQLLAKLEQLRAKPAHAMHIPCMHIPCFHKCRSLRALRPMATRPTPPRWPYPVRRPAAPTCPTCTSSGTNGGQCCARPALRPASARRPAPAPRFGEATQEGPCMCVRCVSRRPILPGQAACLHERIQ